MPYLDVAARQLGVSEKTLRKWLRQVEPPIEPTPHQRDRRYHVISDAEVERVRQALAERPGIHTPPALPALTDASRTRYGANLGERPSQPIQLPLAPARPRQRPVSASPDGLPDGMLSRTDVATLHTFPASTLRRWCDEGRIETDAGVYGGAHGQFQAARPVTARGLAQFWRLAHQRSDFTTCPDCPHAEDTQRDG